MTQTVKNLPVMQETQVQSLGQEDPLEEGMATYSSILAGKSHGEKSLKGYSLDTTEAIKQVQPMFRDCQTDSVSVLTEF